MITIGWAIVWAVVAAMTGACLGVLIMAALVAGSDDLTAIIHRLQEMEYAVEGGNLAREDVPADTLKNWFRYVWTGEAQK